MATPVSQLSCQLLVTTILHLLLAIVLSDLFIPQLCAAAEEQLPVTHPHCRDKCGDISIPFPFGIGPGCFIADQFEVFCNDSTRPPRLFLAPSAATYQKNGEVSISNASARIVLDETAISRSPIELVGIEVASNVARAYGAVSSYCIKSPTEQVLKLQLTNVGPSNTSWPLTLSMKQNALVGVGVNMQARLASRMYMDLPNSDALTSCTSVAAIDDFYSLANGSCTGNGCCKVPFAGRAGRRRLDISAFAVSFKPGNPLEWEEYPCSYGMVVESSWYNFSTTDLYGYEVLPKELQRGVPFVMDFAILNGSCPPEGQQPAPGYACASSNSFCTNTNTTGYVCECSLGYEGNPYIINGCQDIDECKGPHQCHGMMMQCKNVAGSYACMCKSGAFLGNGGDCIDIISLVAKVIAGGVGFIILLVIFFIVLLRREKRKTRGFYQKNGGLILEKANFLKLYEKKELKPILKSINFIGKGGFGQVYKGVLRNVLVAVKKPINGSVLENEQFANEVFIQSQINHKNIVRLIGCCLEVDIPMLVYEFLSKGSLEDMLHGQDKMAVSLDLRLRIAAESADGLSYMHSKTATKILHGDVKPGNILLDENFVPKVSDFGLSRLIVTDKEHALSVIGDRSYMDPVYLQTGLLTEKSDVYSFGVVILELISRERATYSNNNSLVNKFVEAHKNEKKSTEYFDKEIAVTRDLELLDSLAEVAVECLSLHVDQRPTMTQVAERLHKLSLSREV